MRQLFSRYEALIFVIIMIAAFVFIATRALNQMQVETIRDEWQTNFNRYSVPLEDILVGGMGKDGIRPIDTPLFQDVAQARAWLNDAAPVVVVRMGGESRAYPLEVLMRHEVVNDVMQDRPIAVTFCPLCHSPMVYDRRVNGDVLRLGVSGNLYKSGFIMWDDATESWWSQFTGEAIVGDYTGTKLQMIPSQLVSFAAFAAHYPAGLVLAGGAEQPDLTYGRNPYVGYDTHPDPFMLTGSEADTRLFPTMRVLAGYVDEQPVAYAYDVLMQARVINDTVNTMAVVAFWQAGVVSTLDRADIDQSRDVGMAALYQRHVNGDVLTFYYDGKDIRDHQTESTWNIFGEATAGQLRGVQLVNLNCNTKFWFAWASANPDTRIYEADT